MQPSEADSASDELFLMEIMEAREAAEDAGSEDELGRLQGENDNRCAAMESTVENLLRDGEWDRVREEVGKWKFWIGLGEALRAKQINDEGKAVKAAVEDS